MNGKRARSLRRLVEAGTIGLSAEETRRLYRQTKHHYTRTRWNAGRLTFDPRPG